MSLKRLLLPGVCLAIDLIVGDARALDCPAPPVQAAKDWESTVNAEVGKIGVLSGAQLQTRVLNATRDLMGKLPGADRVYLEQMMFASYCSALKDDKSLSESAKAQQILAYRRELRSSFADSPGKGTSGKTSD